MSENGNTGAPKQPWWVVGAILIPLTLATFGKVAHTTFANAEHLAEINGEMRERRYRLEQIEKKLDHIIRRLEVLD